MLILDNFRVQAHT
jgi:hypothetical protein